MSCSFLLYSDWFVCLSVCLFACVIVSFHSLNVSAMLCRWPSQSVNLPAPRMNAQKHRCPSLRVNAFIQSVYVPPTRSSWSSAVYMLLPACEFSSHIVSVCQPKCKFSSPMVSVCLPKCTFSSPIVSVCLPKCKFSSPVVSVCLPKCKCPSPVVALFLSN